MFFSKRMLPLTGFLALFVLAAVFYFGGEAAYSGWFKFVGLGIILLFATMGGYYIIFGVAAYQNDPAGKWSNFTLEWIISLIAFLVGMFLFTLLGICWHPAATSIWYYPRLMIGIIITFVEVGLYFLAVYNNCGKW